MKAIVWTRYGPPEGLQLREVESPIPGEGEILVRVHATSVTAGDCEMRRLELPLMLSLPVRLYAGLSRPKRIPILGQELAGVVEAVGARVEAYRPGDRVFGTTGFGFGAYAEYVCLPAEPGDAQGALAPMPGNLSYAQAAAVPTAGLEALHYLRAGKAGPGTQVLVVGAGGSIGTFAVQLARHFGAEVTAVDRADKLDLLRALGAGRVIDYTREEYTRYDDRYDLIVDVVGRRQVARRLRLLKEDGAYFLAYAGPTDLLRALASKKRLRIESAGQTKEDLLALKGLLEAGSLQAVVDRSYPLEALPEAHRYVESGAKRGNVVIQVAQGV